MPTNDKVVYLAGPIIGLSYANATAWRDEATEYLAAAGFGIYDPMRPEQKLEEVFAGGRPINDKEALPVVGDPFKRDVWMIQQSDLLLVNLLNEKGASRGTAWEMGYAYALNKGIVVVTRTTHPFIQNCAIHTTESLEDAVEWIIEQQPVFAGTYVPSPVWGAVV